MRVLQPRRSVRRGEVAGTERGDAQWRDAEGWPQAGAWVSDCLGVRGLGVERGHYWHCPGGQLRVALLFVSHPTTAEPSHVVSTVSGHLGTLHLYTLRARCVLC